MGYLALNFQPKKNLLFYKTTELFLNYLNFNKCLTLNIYKEKPMELLYC
jgi:hypothetical protein